MAFVKNIQTGKVQRWLTKNVSGSGLCLIADQDIARGAKLEIELKLPDYSAPFVLPAEVVWTMTAQQHGAGSTELGVLFIDPPAKIKAMLDQYAVMNAPPEAG